MPDEIDQILQIIAENNVDPDSDAELERVASNVAYLARVIRRMREPTKETT